MEMLGALPNVAGLQGEMYMSLGKMQENYIMENWYISTYMCKLKNKKKYIYKFGEIAVFVTEILSLLIRCSEQEIDTFLATVEDGERGTICGSPRKMGEVWEKVSPVCCQLFYGPAGRWISGIRLAPVAAAAALPVISFGAQGFEDGYFFKIFGAFCGAWEASRITWIGEDWMEIKTGNSMWDFKRLKTSWSCCLSQPCESLRLMSKAMCF